MIDSVENWQNYLPSWAFELHQPFEFFLCPVLFEKRPAKNNHPEPGLCKSAVDFAAQAVSELQHVRVQPHLGTCRREQPRQRFGNGRLVFTRVADEQIPTHFSSI